MALWIEESRLHDPSLFLDALPDVYKPAELTKLFQGDQVGNFQFSAPFQILLESVQISINGFAV